MHGLILNWCSTQLVSPVTASPTFWSISSAGKCELGLQSDAIIWLAHALDQRQADSDSVRHLLQTLRLALAADLPALALAHLQDQQLPYRLMPMGWPVSFSHSGQGSLCAVGRVRRLAVDLEHRSIPPRVWRRFFAQAEWQQLEQLPADLAQIQANRWWRLKECQVKLGLAPRLLTALIHPVSDIPLTVKYVEQDHFTICWQDSVDT